MKRYFTIQEAINLFFQGDRIPTERMVKNWIKKGINGTTLLSYKIGTKYFLTEQDICIFLESQSTRRIKSLIVQSKKKSKLCNVPRNWQTLKEKHFG